MAPRKQSKKDKVVNKKKLLELQTIGTQANQIFGMNTEIKYFISKLQHFRKKKNIIDKSLYDNLNLLIGEVDSFLDGNPKELDLDSKKSEFDVNFEENGIERIYVCGFCECIVEDKGKTFYKHLMSPIHATKKQQGERNYFKFGENKSRNTKKEDMQKQELTKKAKEFISGDFETYTNEAMKIGNSVKESPAYLDMKLSLIEKLKPVYPDVDIHFFGSRMNGLGSIDSDLDIFIDPDYAFYEYNLNGDSCQKKFSIIAKMFKHGSSDWRRIRAIQSARVPIVRVYNKKHNIECDLSFSNGLAKCNTLLVRHLFEMQPIVQKLCCFVKKWLQTTNLNLQLSTYTFVLMVIFYFQLKGFLPSIEELQRDIEPLFIGPWQANFAPKTLKEFKLTKLPADALTFRVHITSFFRFCGNFSFDKSVMSPFLGRIISKQSLNSSPDLLKRYHDYKTMKGKEEGFQIDRAMCVQDPLEQNHNVAKGISQRGTNLTQHYCRLTAELLNQDSSAAVEKQVSVPGSTSTTAGSSHATTSASSTVVVPSTPAVSSIVPPKNASLTTLGTTASSKATSANAESSKTIPAKNASSTTTPTTAESSKTTPNNSSSAIVASKATTAMAATSKTTTSIIATTNEITTGTDTSPSASPITAGSTDIFKTALSTEPPVAVASTASLKDTTSAASLTSASTSVPSLPSDSPVASINDTSPTVVYVAAASSPTPTNA